MVTYEGIFMFITTLTCVVALVLDIIDRRKNEASKITAQATNESG